MRKLNQLEIESISGGLKKSHCDFAGGLLGGIGFGLSLTGVGGPIGIIVSGAGLIVTMYCAG